MVVVEEAVDPYRIRRHRALLGRFAEGGPGSGLVAVPGTTRQRPSAALMAPDRAMLQQHRGGTVGSWGPQQQTGRAVPTPIVGAAVGYHPSVTVAMHAFRICRRSPKLGPPPPIRPDILLEFAYTGSSSAFQWPRDEV